MKTRTYQDQELVQLATRIPRNVVRRLKEFCVRNDVRMQSFVRTALAEKLARARRGTRQRSQAWAGRRGRPPHPLRPSACPYSFARAAPSGIPFQLQGPPTGRNSVLYGQTPDASGMPIIADL
jgi:hypothetical protein